MKKSLALFATVLAAVLNAATPSTSLVYKETANSAITGDLTFPSGKTLTLNGTLAGTPAGGTLNLSAVTLTPPSNIVTLTGTQTLTNKTLTSPTLTTPSIGAATGTSLSLTGAATSNNAFLVDTNTSFVSHTATAGKLQAQTSWGGVISGFGTTNDVSIFNKSGGLALSVPTGTTNVGIAGTLLIPDGTTAAPSLTFAADTNTGIARAATDSLEITAGGARSALFTSTGQTVSGNLTVSGTGTSSVAGSLGIGTTSPNKTSLSTMATVNGASSSGFEVAVGDTRIAGLYASSTVAVLNAFANVPIDFSTNNTTRMRLTNDGNLGVGTIDPNRNLEVSNASGAVIGIASTTTSASTMYGRLAFYSTGFDKNYINHGAEIRSYSNSGIDQSDLRFYTSNAATAVESMRLRPDGILQVGTTSVTGAKLVVVAPSSIGRVSMFRSTYSGDISNAGVGVSKYDNDTTTSQVFMNFSVNNDTAANGQINANGASQAAFGSWSDRRLKTNITDLPSQWNNIKSLRPVEFDYIQSEGGGHQIGFIAQEVEPIYGDLVGKRADGMLTLSGMGKGEARLIKALQEAITRIETLEAKVAALEAARN